jgi:quinol monooxygenase YgiN/mannose-6-phosphate isomerase-like protein (cupin superfamily)
VKLTAKPGQGDALADLLLQAAAALAEVPGCELYVINRAPSEPDVVWVTELWHSQEQLDASLQTEGARAQIPLALELLSGPPERIDVQPVGGVGYLPGGSGFTIANLNEVEDAAAKYGYSEMGEARFARAALEAASTGLSLQRLRPGRMQMFAHRHHHAEEVYVVLSGHGRIKVDDEIREVGPLDAIRVAPDSTRAFQAGPDGLELLALGPHHSGDAEMVRDDFWPS